MTSASLAGVECTVKLRDHQRDVLEELDEQLANGHKNAKEHPRAWVVLPPGAGKTIVGLDVARRLQQPTVIFSPNTAIQMQWVAEWSARFTGTATAGTTRDLRHPVTSLTYQSLATFDPDAEVSEEGTGTTHIARLRENGRELVAAIQELPHVTLILDECHHLLDTWGELVAEVLRELENATVIGLTATPPSQLTKAEAKLVDELFGTPIVGPSIPAVVKSGYLAPFAELAWLTTPTVQESDWLAAEAERFAELTNDLLDPGFASTPFFSWLDARIVTRADDEDRPLVSWHRFQKDEPELAAAGLRLHHHGLLATPRGAQLGEEHRRAPTAADWVALLEDYATNCLWKSDDPKDQRAVDAIRRALPSVGYTLTKRGIRSSRSLIDRVLARSAAKIGGAVEILANESTALGDNLRALVVCDHERAMATLPARLTGVIDEQAGSARLVLDELIADERTARLRPMLVTGRTVAAAPDVAKRFVDFCAEHDHRLELTTTTNDGASVEITGRWSSKRWVPLATRFFEDGGVQALVGTRGMLGEGWDARRVNTLVDLTEATTATSVVQTRGRALRLDPDWPEKTAHNWSLVCVSPDHPTGANDWDRFVRKHTGYFALTPDGAIMSGVGHVDLELSPYAPPEAETFDDFNTSMLLRAQERRTIRELWEVGVPYKDRVVHAIRVTSSGDRKPPPPPDSRPAILSDTHPPRAVPAARYLHPPLPAAVLPLTLAALCTVFVAPVLLGALGLLCVPLVTASAWVGTRAIVATRRLRDAPPDLDLAAMARALADALHDCSLVSRGADALEAMLSHDGTYLLELRDVPESESAVFASAFDELISPVGDPRYLIPRYILANRSRWAALSAAAGRPVTNDVVYHAVPSVLGANADRVRSFATAWERRVSHGEPIYTRMPEGAGVLAAYAGTSPTDCLTAFRESWI